MAEAQVEHPLGRDRVEVFVAVGIGDVDAIAMDEAHVDVAHALDHVFVGFVSQPLRRTARIPFWSVVVHVASLAYGR